MTSFQIWRPRRSLCPSRRNTWYPFSSTLFGGHVVARRRAGQALSIYFRAASSAIFGRLPHWPRPMLLLSSCSAPCPSSLVVVAAVNLRVESILLLLSVSPPSPAATPWTRSGTTSGSRATSVGQLSDSGNPVPRSNNRRQSNRTRGNDKKFKNAILQQDLRREEEFLRFVRPQKQKWNIQALKTKKC